jgi:hypothetical protein
MLIASTIEITKRNRSMPTPFWELTVEDHPGYIGKLFGRKPRKRTFVSDGGITWYELVGDEEYDRCEIELEEWLEERVRIAQLRRSYSLAPDPTPTT